MIVRTICFIAASCQKQNSYLPRFRLHVWKHGQLWPQPLFTSSHLWHEIISLPFSVHPEPFDEDATDADSFPPSVPSSPTTSTLPSPVNQTFSSPPWNSSNTTAVPSGESCFSCCSSLHLSPINHHVPSSTLPHCSFIPLISPHHLFAHIFVSSCDKYEHVRVWAGLGGLKSDWPPEILWLWARFHFTCRAELWLQPEHHIILSWSSQFGFWKVRSFNIGCINPEKPTFAWNPPSMISSLHHPLRSLPLFSCIPLLSIHRSSRKLHLHHLLHDGHHW